jgi:hypothetical protein
VPVTALDVPDEVRDKPGGKLPLDTVNVYGLAPPVTLMG